MSEKWKQWIQRLNLKIDASSIYCSNCGKKTEEGSEKNEVGKQ